MPFDGTRQVDATGRIILEALDILRRDGWCVGAYHNLEGAHCTVGALTVGKDYVYAPSLERLARAIPNDFEEGWRTFLRVTGYNDAQTDFSVIEEWFERAAYMKEDDNAV